MNWNNIEHIDFEINAKTGKKYYQQYLKPCYFLELHFRWTFNDDILALHQSVIKEIGHLFSYHHNSNKSKESKIKDTEKTFNTIPDFLASNKNYIWHELSNNGGVGSDKTIGGASDALLSYWIHKTPFSEKTRIQQVQKHRELLKAFDTNMLGSGIRMSKITVCFPINHFKNTDVFFSWIIHNECIKNGTFFSGSAGYRVNFWEGYVNKNASDKLHQLLTDFPGLDFDIKGNTLGRVLNENKTDFLPIVKRLNWLTFISKEGVEQLNGIDKLKADVEKDKISKLIQLKNGVCIKASKEPALSEKDPNFNQYYNLHKIIDKLKFRNHPRDNQEFLGWLNKFEE